MSVRLIPAVLTRVKHEAWIARDWEDEGMTWVVVARERDAGVVSMGAFLVDVWCLGVKDAYVDELTRAEFDDLLGEQLPAQERLSLEPACAKRMIEGAVAYAQSLGFLPHRDFRKARKVLNGLDAAACPREFTFGCHGRPRFVIGPADDDVRVGRVLAVLTARFGSDGFDVEELEESDDADAEGEDAIDWEALDTLFRFVESEHCPDRSLSGFVVSGFVAAAVTVDPAREPHAGWAELFGGMEPALPENEAFLPEDILDGFLELWSDTEARFAAGEFAASLPPLDEPDHFSAAAAYCRGFLRVFDARIDLVAELNQDPAASAALATLRQYCTAVEDRAGATAGSRSAAPPIAEATRTLGRVVTGWRTQGK